MAGCNMTAMLAGVDDEWREIAGMLPVNHTEELFQQYQHVEQPKLLELYKEALQECRDNGELQVYDFCIIASDEDLEVAFKIKDDITRTLNLKGCMFEDIVMAGQDILQCYENMMERSSKILFLITKYFEENAFCKRIQNAMVFRGLLNKAKKTEEKCIPIILQSQPSVSIPIGLTGINGIKYYDVPSSAFNFLGNLFRNSKSDRYKLRKKIIERVCSLEFKSRVNRYLEETEREDREIEKMKRLHLTFHPADESAAVADESACEVRKQQTDDLEQQPGTAQSKNVLENSLPSETSMECDNNVQCNPSLTIGQPKQNTNEVSLPVESRLPSIACPVQKLVSQSVIMFSGVVIGQTRAEVMQTNNKILPNSPQNL